MRKVKNLILGKGFMGLAVWGGLRDVDKEIIWTYKPESASKSAAGIITESWYLAKTIRNQYEYPFTKEMVSNGLKFLRQNGAHLTLADEVRINELNKNFRVAKDTWLVWNSAEYLNQPKNQNQSNILEIDFQNKIVTTDKEKILAENLFVCLGINLLDFTKEIPIKGRLGQAIFLNVPEKTTKTYYVAPYTHFTMRPWSDGTTRIGDTTKTKHLDYLVNRFGKGKVVSGIRPAPIGRGKIYHKIGNTHVFTNGGRVGLGLSGMVGFYLEDLINKKIEF